MTVLVGNNQAALSTQTGDVGGIGGEAHSENHALFYAQKFGKQFLQFNVFVEFSCRRSKVSEREGQGSSTNLAREVARFQHHTGG